jgi:phosphomannomutase
LSFVDPAAIRPFNVVLDAGSGMGGLVAPRLFDRLPCKTTRLCFKIDGLSAKYQAGKVYTMDGVSAEFPDWHFNVRGSNTEPMLRLNLEATSQALMEQKRDEVLAYIRG